MVVCIQSDEVHIFRGQEEPAKEVECVLIYDPESDVSSMGLLNYNRRQCICDGYFFARYIP